MEWLIRLVSDVRSARTELNVPPGERLIGYVEREDPALFELLADNQDALLRMAKVSYEPVLGKRPGPVLRVSAGTSELVMPLQGTIDVDAEAARLLKAATAAEKERDSLAQRLANRNFTERAKPEAVEKARADYEAKAAEAERLRAALERLG
jgi:valyl-tRNA synthetase